MTTTIVTDDKYFRFIDHLAERMADIEKSLRADAVAGGLDDVEGYVKRTMHMLLRCARGKSDALHANAYWLDTDRADTTALRDYGDGILRGSQRSAR